MQRFFLHSDNENGELYLFCTSPLCYFLVKRDELELIAGRPDENVIADANVFLNEFPFRRFELKRKSEK